MFILLTVASLLAPAAADPRASVECVISAWNAYDVERSRRCYAESAVALRGGERVALDWNAERRYRAFDAAAHSRFGFEVLQSRESSVAFALHETNDFLGALGVEGVTVRWRYDVADGVIVAEELLKSDAAFPAVFREFSAWGRDRQPAGWTSVLDADGQVLFDGATAPHLIALAREWVRSKR